MPADRNQSIACKKSLGVLHVPPTIATDFGSDMMLCFSLAFLINSDDAERRNAARGGERYTLILPQSLIHAYQGAEIVGWSWQAIRIG